jgi:hypothetical protein
VYVKAGLEKDMEVEARSGLTRIPYAATREEAEQNEADAPRMMPEARPADVGGALDRDWERMVAF